MKKFNVGKIYLETKDGYNASKQWDNAIDPPCDIVGSYDTMEEATNKYNDLIVDVRYMGGYYLHNGRFIEVVHYTQEEDGTLNYDYDEGYIKFELNDRTND